MSKTAASVVQEAVEPTNKWLDADGKQFEEAHVFDWIRKIKLDPENDYQVIVGTDSHMHGRLFRFVTVVCVYRVGKGGYYYYMPTYESRDNYIANGQRGRKVKGNQKLRMFNEVEKSISTAERIFESTGVLPVVHIDASPSHLREFTSDFSDQLKGYVTGQGFECVLKPESFVANAVADKHTK